MSSKTVYVVQNAQWRDNETGTFKPKFDLNPALEYGELCFLLTPTARPFNTESILADLHKKLKNYRAGQDCLLLTGNPVLIGLAVAVALHYGGGNATILQWDGMARSYIPIHVKDAW